MSFSVDIKVELAPTIPGIDATSERAIYDHYGFIQIPRPQRPAQAIRLGI